MWFSLHLNTPREAEALRLDCDNGADHSAAKWGRIHMTDKQARKFDKLLEAHKDARQRRKVAAAARGEVKGVDGRSGLLAALASSAGTKAVEAELDALRAERRALKKLHKLAVEQMARAIARSKEEAARPKKPKQVAAKPKLANGKPAKIKGLRKEVVKAGSAEPEPIATSQDVKS
jgi:hypothetical protein